MEEALRRFGRGEFIIVFDEHREEEADFFILAEYITPQSINFLLKKACGMICVACESKILDRLEIPLITAQNTSIHQTNFCIPVDGGKEITTGVSASDRAEVIKLLASKNSCPTDFMKPGHTFPLRAENDFSKRFGHTEAAVLLAKKCNKIPVVVICEILNESGEKASLKDIVRMKKEQENDFFMLTLEDVKLLI